MKTQGLFQRLVLAGMLAGGFAALWGVLALWAVQVAEHVLSSDQVAEGLVFLPDGQARRTSCVSPYEGLQYRDLEGNPLPPEDQADARQRGIVLPVSLYDDPVRERPWEQRIRSLGDGGLPAVYWYFVSDGSPEGAGYFVGYDSKSKACVGYLGTAGLRSGPLPPSERIPFAGATWPPRICVLCIQPHDGPTSHPGNLSGPVGRPSQGSVSMQDAYVVGRDERIYHADLRRRTLEVVFQGPRLRSAALVSGLADPVRGTPTWLVARTDEAVVVLDARGKLLERYPIPPALRQQEFTFSPTTIGEGLMYQHSPLDVLAKQIDYGIYWVKPDGHFRQAQATLARGEDMMSWPIISGLSLPAPLVLTGVVGTFRPASLLEEGLAATYPEALGRALREFRPALLLAMLAGGVLAGLCYRRQVRYGARGMERLAWPLFVLALGLPGWIGYRFGRTWPVLQSCPSCGAAVPRDREECVHCRSEFPTPALKGTEVFA